MKEAIKLFNRITRNAINVDDFYAININEDTIRFQGKMSSGGIVKYNKIVELSLDAEDGKISGQRKIGGYYIRIVLYY